MFHFQRNEERWIHQSCANNLVNRGYRIDILVDTYSSRFENRCHVCRADISLNTVLTKVKANKNILIPDSVVAELKQIAIVSMRNDGPIDDMRKMPAFTTNTRITNISHGSSGCTSCSAPMCQRSQRMTQRMCQTTSRGTQTVNPKAISTNAITQTPADICRETNNISFATPKTIQMDSEDSSSDFQSVESTDELSDEELEHYLSNLEI